MSSYSLFSICLRLSRNEGCIWKAESGSRDAIVSSFSLSYFKGVELGSMSFPLFDPQKCISFAFFPLFFSILKNLLFCFTLPFYFG